jgi:hypothetical protein
MKVLIKKRVEFYELCMVEVDHLPASDELETLFEVNGMDDISDYIVEPTYSVEQV